MHSRVELLDAAAVDATTEPRYRHLFQTLRKRGYPESQSDKSGARQTRMDRVDRINIRPVISGGDARHQPAKGKYFVGTDNAASDMIPFTFQDVVNNKWLVFRATLNGISESTSATYNTVDYINRADSMKIYSGFARTVNFNFEVVPYSQVEMRPLWQKLNYLTGLCAPSYGTTARKGGYMVSPFVKLTIGDMYRGQTGVLTSVTLSVDDAAGWDIDYSVEFNTRRLPKHVSVSVSFDIIETQTPSRDGIYYSGPIYMGGESSVTRSGVGGSDFNLRDISIPVSEGVPVSNIPDVPVVPPRPRPPRNDMRPPPVPTVPGFNAPPPGAVTIPPTPTITPPRIRRP